LPFADKFDDCRRQIGDVWAYDSANFV